MVLPFWESQWSWSCFLIKKWKKNRVEFDVCITILTRTRPFSFSSGIVCRTAVCSIISMLRLSLLVAVVDACHSRSRKRKFADDDNLQWLRRGRRKATGVIFGDSPPHVAPSKNEIEQRKPASSNGLIVPIPEVKKSKSQKRKKKPLRLCVV